MEVRLEIELELWEALKLNYENQNYSSSILDAMHMLTEIIRNKTGLEGDGANLVGQAFGGENPRIQLNKLQTDSEKDIQKGTQDLLKGLYTSIRNPRSHDKLMDTKQQADSIIIFIDYLLKQIDKSKISFNEEVFLKRVFDKYFVNTEEYADLLVSEVPKRQRANIAISVILAKSDEKIESLKFFMSSLFEKLEAPEITRIFKVVSDELKFTSDHKDIRIILGILPADYWSEIDKVVRLRIENILYQDVKLATYLPNNDMCGEAGALGTWVEYNHLINFTDNNSWTYLIVQKLKSGDVNQTNYVNKYYWSIICKLNYKDIHYSLKCYISDGLEKQDKHIIEKLKQEIIYDEKHPWWKVFEKELTKYPDIKYCELPF